MMYKNQHSRPSYPLSDGRPETQTIMTTVGKYRWDAGQSSSDAFVRDFGESDLQVSKSV